MRADYEFEVVAPFRGFLEMEPLFLSSVSSGVQEFRAIDR
jgi:hypothetical protein